MDSSKFVGEAPLDNLDPREVKRDLDLDPQFDIHTILKPLVYLILNMPKFCHAEWMQPDYTFYLTTGSSMLFVRIEDNENPEIYDVSSWYLYKEGDRNYTNIACTAVVEHLMNFINATRNHNPADYIA